MLVKLKRFVIKAIEWKSRNGMTILRFSLGIIFIWFGILKFFPNVSVAEDIAGRTIRKITFGMVTKQYSMPFLALWECTIGIGLITGKKMVYILFILYLQMIGTFLPLVLFSGECWTSVSFAPTLLGQYIIKNVVLVSSAIVIGATANGGALISNPLVAIRALKLQSIEHKKN
ncbi:hypothetical protein GJU39_17215 [Pedobacter petrophilus]|uniref:DoxX family membrane protein n=1 Tax=Pedobacter petrophilus TaxID=1908241 RepID=A0A7K0G210_9SPHI|nr:hypothetical protein [Pedobacter petrophilus]MRX77825.1 hypothetical protein [Pedobacter petrophilus]